MPEYSGVLNSADAEMLKTARYFKIETMGTVDGPGIRMVLFLQGCRLRCPYCHNPESWQIGGGKPISSDEVMDRLRSYAGFYKNGGLTISGGEPLLQAEFVNELQAKCKAENIHVALDTSGFGDDSRAAARVVDEADLLLLDIKLTDSDRHKSILGESLEKPLSYLARREKLNRPVWIRHVVVPGLTDSGENIDRLKRMLSPYKCVEKVELLPFRKLCLSKYSGMGISFPLEQVPEAQAGLIEELKRRYEMSE